MYPFAKIANVHITIFTPLPPVIGCVVRVPLPLDLCSRLLDRLILRWVDMMRSWNHDDDDKTRSLVHSVLVSLATPDSLDHLRIDKTLETFACEAAVFVGNRLDQYVPDSLVISLWALQRVETSAKMSLHNLDSFFEKALGSLAESWGLLEDHQSLSLQRLLQISRVVLQRHPISSVTMLWSPPSQTA